MLLIESHLFIGLAIFFAVIIGIFGFYLPYWKQKNHNTYRTWFHNWISKDNAFWVVDLTICGLVIQTWRTSYGKEVGMRRIHVWWNIHKLS